MWKNIFWLVRSGWVTPILESLWEAAVLSQCQGGAWHSVAHHILDVSLATREIVDTSMETSSFLVRGQCGTVHYSKHHIRCRILISLQREYKCSYYSRLAWLGCPVRAQQTVIKLTLGSSPASEQQRYARCSTRHQHTIRMVMLLWSFWTICSRRETWNDNWYYVLSLHWARRCIVKVIMGPIGTYLEGY